jgi:hypothetical protein
MAPQPGSGRKRMPVDPLALLACDEDHRHEEAAPPQLQLQLRRHVQLAHGRCEAPEGCDNRGRAVPAGPPVALELRLRQVPPKRRDDGLGLADLGGRRVPRVRNRLVAELFPALLGEDARRLVVLEPDLTGLAVEDDRVRRARRRGVDRGAGPAEQPAHGGGVGRCQRTDALEDGLGLRRGLRGLSRAGYRG